MIGKIKAVLMTFCCVTTCVVFCTAVFIQTFWGKTQVSSDLLWQIFIVSFLCSLGSGIYPEKKISRGKSFLLIAFHYLLVNGIVLGCGLWFEWFYADNLAMVLCMLLLIFGVFTIVSSVMWYHGKQTAKQLNEKLREYQSAQAYRNADKE